MTQSNDVIGFIGLGVMGKSMAANLLKAGFEVFVYTRTEERQVNFSHWVQSGHLNLRKSHRKQM